MKRKLLALLLSAALCLGLLSGISLAATGGSCGSGLTWSLSGGTLTISGSGAMTNYTYSSPAPWFDSYNSITKVVIGSSVTSIGDYAFRLCYNLTSVSLGSSLTSIGSMAFYNTGLTSFTVPASVTAIGDGAFANTDITSYSVASGNTSFKVTSGVLFSYDGTTLVSYPRKSTATSYSVPYTVETIAPYAFYENEYLTSITFNSSSRLVHIGDHAFYSCNRLASIKSLPTSLRTVGSYAINSASLTSITYKGTSSLWSKYVAVSGSNSLSSLSYGSATHPNHPICGLTCTCTDTHHVPSAWNSWNGKSSTSNGGYYYLSTDVVRESYYGFTGTVRICLNDHTIATNGESIGFEITSTGSLTVTDCGTNGTIISTDGNDASSSSAEYAVYNEGKYTQYGGELISDTGLYNAEGATATIYGGSFYGDQMGIWNDSSTVTAQNALISGEMGGLWSYGGTCTLKNVSVYGGLDSSDDMTVTGGSVSGTLSNYGTMTVTGTSVNGYIYNGSYGTVTLNNVSLATEYNSSGTAVINYGTMTANNLSVTFSSGSYGTALLNSGTLHLNGGSLPAVLRDGFPSPSLHSASSSARTYISGAASVPVLRVDYPNTVVFASSSGSAYTGQDPIKIFVNFTSTGVVASKVSSSLASRITQINFYGEPDESNGSLVLQGTNLMLVGIVAKGKCGDNLNWVLTGDGKLTISGTGDMYDYDPLAAPWNAYRTQIKSLIIEDGCTYVGSHAFYACDALTSVTFGRTQMDIGTYAFANCTALTNIDIPANVQLGYGTFQWCEGLTSATVACPTVPTYAFELCKNLQGITLKEGVETVEYGALRRTDALTSITFPASVEEVEYNVFAGNDSGTSQLKRIIFLSPTTVIDPGFLNYMPTGQITIEGGECSTAAQYASNLSMTFQTRSGIRSHAAGTPTRENEVPATCKEAGSYDEVTRCSVCSAELSRVEKSIDKLTTHTPGTPVRENEAPATCTSPVTFEEVTYCTVCEGEISRTRKSEGDPLGHSHTDKPSDRLSAGATCTEPAAYFVQCDRCGDIHGTLTVSVGDPLGHSMGGWTIQTPAGYLSEGTERSDCSVCDYYEERPIPATGSAVVDGIGVVVTGSSITLVQVPEDLTVIVAVYTADGQMTDVCISTSGSGVTRTLTLPAPAAGTSRKLFVLTDCLIPIGPVRILP